MAVLVVLVVLVALAATLAAVVGAVTVVGAGAVSLLAVFAEVDAVAGNGTGSETGAGAKVC